jgi:hypothetical protein
MNQPEGAWGAFYSPPRESAYCGVRDPDMSRLGARHVYKGLFESSHGTGHVQCWDLTQVIT